MTGFTDEKLKLNDTPGGALFAARYKLKYVIAQEESVYRIHF